MESPGEILREARRRRGLSPEEVFRLTRVRPVLLEYLEEDLLSALPEEPYGRSLYSSVARAVEADVGRVLDAYDRLLTTRRAAVGEPEAAPPPSSRRPVGVIAGLAVLVALAGLLWFLGRREGMPRREAPPTAEAPAAGEGYSASLSRPGGPPGPTGTEEAVEEALASTPVFAMSLPAPRASGGAEGSSPSWPVHPLDSDSPPEGGVGPGRELVLVARAVSDTWVRVVADGRRRRAGILPAGEERVWRAAEELRLDLGNAEGLRLTVNGRPVVAPEARGGVVHFALTWDLLASDVSPDHE